MPFQNKINYQQAPGNEGDFASANPYASYLSGEGQLVSGPNGTIVGRFAWVDVATGETSNKGTGVPSGFVHREGQASIIDWLAEASLVVPTGYMITLMTAGDFWIRTKTAATIGQKVFAMTADGSASTGDAGGTVSGGVETKFTVMSTGAAGELIKMSYWGASV